VCCLKVLDDYNIACVKESNLIMDKWILSYPHFIKFHIYSNLHCKNTEYLHPYSDNMQVQYLCHRVSLRWFAVLGNSDHPFPQYRPDDRGTSVLFLSHISHFFSFVVTLPFDIKLLHLQLLKLRQINNPLRTIPAC
jgi:hypothetical protein